MPMSAPLSGEFLSWSPTRANKPTNVISGWTGDGDGRRGLTSEPKLQPTPATLQKFFHFSTVQRKAWTPSDDAQLRNLVSSHGSRDWKAVERSATFGHSKQACEIRWLNMSRPTTAA